MCAEKVQLAIQRSQKYNPLGERDMKDKCLAGIDPDTNVVEVIAALNPKENVYQHILEITEAGYHCVAADYQEAVKAWGKKIDSIEDILTAD